MANQKRRTVLTSGAALLSGSLLVSSGAVGKETASEDESSTDAGDSNEGGEDIVIDIQDGWTRGSDSVHVDQAPRMTVELCVRNYGDEPVSVPLEYEIGPFEEVVETLEIGPNESEDERIGYIHPRSLGPGEHDWTISAGEATKTGTVLVEADEDYEDRDEGFHILADASGISHDPVGETIVDTYSPPSNHGGFYIDIEVTNYHYEAVEEDLIFEVDGETMRWPLELEPREHVQTYFSFSLEEGEYEWTASIGDDSISGRLKVVFEEKEEEEYCNS